MRNKSDVEKELARIKSDERLGYPPANVFSNAPLALIQVELQARVHALAWVLEGNYYDDDSAAEQNVQATRLSPSSSQALGDNPPSA